MTRQALKIFDEMNRRYVQEKVKCDDVVKSFGKLMELVRI
jgi:hypothetical protein